MVMASTIEAVDLPFQEAIDFMAQKAAVPTQRWTDVWETAHSRAFMVAGAASQALVQDFQKAIQKAIEQGTTLQEFRKDFYGIVDKHGWHGWTGEGNPKTEAWRIRTIYETNLNMAYSAGRYAQQTDPDVLAIFPFWVYRHSGNPHPRLQHKAWDGLTLRADDAWWRTNYPPNGWGCGCMVESITARGLARMGKTGPDPAPALDLTEKPIGKSGRYQLTPKGVDPGFGYNPGMAWKGEAKVPHDAVMQAGPNYRPPPPVPPAPKLPAVKQHAYNPADDEAPLIISPEAPAQMPTIPAPSTIPAPDKVVTAPALPSPPPAVKKPVYNPADDDAPLIIPPGHGPQPVSMTAKELEDADRILRGRYDPWAQSLSGAEAQTLAAYKSHAYTGINGHLAGTVKRDALTPVIKTLDQALAKAPPTDRPMTVFRGIARTDPIAAVKVGKTVQPRIFMSTSIKRRVAEDFADGGVILEIKVPEAYHGTAWVHPYPDINHREWEMLFRPGSRFRVIDKEPGHITLEAVDEPNRKPRLTPRRTRPSL